MSGKSQHGRQGRKKRYRQGYSPVAIQKPESAGSREPVVPARVPAPPARVPSPVVTIQYPYIVDELRRIGIISVGILVILIVLAVIFS